MGHPVYSCSIPVLSPECDHASDSGDDLTDTLQRILNSNESSLSNGPIMEQLAPLHKANPSQV